jgi:hypothetical protein
MKAQRKPAERPVVPFTRISVAADVYQSIVATGKIKVAQTAPRADGRWNIIISGSLMDAIDTARQKGERSSDVLKRIVKQ